jgi:ABC-2 type transport system permease protein
MTDATLAPPPREVPEGPGEREGRARPRRRGWRDRSLVQLTLVRYREFLREPEAVFWVFIFPVLLAGGLGVAFRNRPAARQPVAVLASAPGAAQLGAVLRSDSSLTVRMLDDSAAARALRTGEVALVAVPAGTASVSYRLDDTRPEARAARLVADAAVQRAAGRRDPVSTRDEQVRERGSRYIDFLVPGLLGMNLMGSGIWGIGFAVVDARKKKLLKRLIATPMRRGEYLASFLLSRLTMLCFEVGTLLGFGVLVFGVPVRGSLAALALICLVASLTFGAMGLLGASRVRTVEGASGLMNLMMLPMWVFSGVFFSSSNFPHAMQPFIQALPLTAVNNMLRANLLQGGALGTMWREMGVTTAWLVVCFLLALKLFRWK